MGAMGRAECVVYIYIRKRGQRTGEPFVVGRLLLMKTQVFQKDDFAGLHPGHGLLDVRPDAIVQLQNGSGEQFRKDFGSNLNVAAHGNHNAYPDFMGQHFKGSSDYHGTPEYIPENIEAAALLAAAVLKFGYSDFDRPAFFEPLNEPHWEFFNDQHLADWHLKTMETVYRATPEVKVGGLCMSVAYMYRDDYKSWKGLKQFIDMTEGKMDFYSFHAYDFVRWENEAFGGRVQSGLPLEGVLDLVQNYTVNTLGKEVDVVVSEQGGYIHGEPRGMYDGEAVAAELARNYFPGDTFEHEMKKRSIVNFVMLSPPTWDWLEMPLYLVVAWLAGRLEVARRGTA